MHIYAGLFLTALATMVFEITLTRLLSVVSWYHLAFFAVSTAMLGMTAGAVTVFLKEKAFDKKNLDSSVSAAAIAFGVSIPVALSVICFTPLVFAEKLSSVFNIIAASSACILPFYFSGIVITAVLTKYNLPAGRIYAADLGGAALGCLLVLWGMDLLDAPNLILLCAPIAALAGYLFSMKLKKTNLNKASVFIAAGLLFVMLANSAMHFIRPRTVKEARTDESRYIFEKWNSFSRVTVLRMSEGWPSFWAGSPAARRHYKEQGYFTARLHHMVIDGIAGTNMLGMDTPADAEYLKYDMVNLAYHIRKGASTCIIGLGGGKDAACAVGFGQKSILGIEVNPIFINDLLKGKLKDFANLADRPEIRFVVDDARSYLARSREKFGLIQMSLIDTWAATGAGAFSLSENGLYTVEAWKIFLNRLDYGGIFTVSRWFNPAQPGETARMINLAKTALFKRGAAEPAAHIVLTYLGNVATLMICSRPFTADELDAVKKICAELEFNILVFPGEEPENIYLKNLIAAKSEKELDRAVSDAPLNYSAATDEKPFFFNMLKLGNLNFKMEKDAGVVKGNLLATMTLLLLIAVLLVFTVLTVVLPLLLGKKTKGKIEFNAAAYFSLIGAGFMLAEIALIQKLSVFLGHPSYALGILLFSMIASAGAGSFFSEKLPLERNPWTILLPIFAGLYILFLTAILPVITGGMEASAMTAKIAAALVLIIPMGSIMGMFFPAGMRIITAEGKKTPDSGPRTPDYNSSWYWALNGIFGVLCSALAVLISIYAGISVNLLISAGCYLSLIYFMPRMGGK